MAAGIAYRAVRNRGTIGGSLCHADSAANWLTTLTLMRAVLLTTTRSIALEHFVTGPFMTVLLPGELVRAVRIPRPAPGARWSYHELCRRPGEFALAMAACLLDRDRGGARLAIGAVGGPIVLTADAACPEEAAAALAYDDAAQTGRVQGGGADQASGRRLSAEATFGVAADAAGSLLTIDVSYSLRGALAHLAKGRVVDLVAGELAAAFGRSLAARLRGEAAPAGAPLSAAGLLLRVARRWLAGLFKKGQQAPPR